MANAWARRVDEGESAKAHAALIAYLELGAARSLVKACGVSTANLRQFEVWSSRWQWVERAIAYDTAQQEIADEARADYIRKVQALPFADPYTRAKKNNRLAARLESMIFEGDPASQEDADENEDNATPQTRHAAARRPKNLWLEGRLGETFNNGIITAYHQTQDAIAADLNQRIKRTDVTSNGETVKGYIGVDTDRV